MHFKKKVDYRLTEGEDYVKSSWPLWIGLHTSDYGLQLAHIKLESLVIAKQHVAVNMLLDFVHTARHIMEVNSF
ncbi:hypothetical protein Ae201684_019033 [Aphanomyces euteiches]|uniref:Uncharacterized protein n=1 Tax=Aphanomyces euteiches TaxID=100861 RepID=A0A6G0W3L3_9STRA|nr:hypothetical protein Ae201684_019033 [Aphanomyces euteiches]